MGYTALLLASFIQIYCLGLQSKNVQHNRKAAAFMTSVCISVCQFIFIQHAATGSIIELTIAALGSACGIVCAITTHQYIQKKKDEKLHNQ